MLSNRGTTILQAAAALPAALDENRQVVPITPGQVSIDLTIVENWLPRPEFLEIGKKAIAEKFGDTELSNNHGFGDDAELLAALASFFTSYMKPFVPLTPSHITATVGAGYSLDALMHLICDAGDSVISPGPFWNGLAPFCFVHPGVKVIPAHPKSLTQALNMDIVSTIRTAYETAPDPRKIRAVVVTNPTNPLAQCYPREVIEAIMQFCEEKGLHYVSDEAYALCQFGKGTPFISALEVGEGLIDRSRVHVIWTASKAFGSSGIRIGCIITQANPLLLAGVSLATYIQCSTLSNTYLTAILQSAALPGLLETNLERLAHNYSILTDALTSLRFDFLPANAGLFVFVKVVKNAQTWEEEANVIRRFAEYGVKVSPGREYVGEDGEKGWARIGFSVPETMLREAISRMKKCIVDAEWG
ncbi:putative aminotransferase aclI [Lachnellula arida]|uniref:Putative aminotransferase aclI n=1 Tax=Lachnellula arida TaxID=1316785 RepID=A0A8T9BJB5_9HELO|nr:putative aminotransferase aclI [Lachnellula arida]